MKIEIAENLVSSYLKHTEGCRIVETNWKTSSTWKTTEYDEKTARDLFDKINNSEFFRGIFKQSSFEQLIKQAEVDVLGINSTEDSVFGIDVAFHSAGLNYGPTERTVSRVMKKIFRTVFIMQSYFSHHDKFNSFFVTPKVNPGVEVPIKEQLEKAREIINDDMISIDFISNDDFFNNIVDPVIDSINKENDTTELFARAIKLLQLDTRVKTLNNIVPSNNMIRRPSIRTEKRMVDGMKIGQYVQYQMRKIYEENLLTEGELQNLQDKEYSKFVFDQNFEVLRSLDKDIADSFGRNRYYSKEKFFGEYFLTSQWVERHWDPFLSWLDMINKNTHYKL